MCNLQRITVAKKKKVAREIVRVTPPLCNVQRSEVVAM